MGIKNLLDVSKKKKKPARESNEMINEKGVGKLEH